jgi:hypothetical protein
MRWVTIVLCCALSGCNSYLARRVVTAPNLKEPTRGVDAPDQTLRDFYVDRQLRIPVGPPDATIAVWICEPWTGSETFSLRTQGRRVMAKFNRKPATAPTTSAATTSSIPKGTVFLLHGIDDNKELGPYVLYREMLVQAGYLWRG